MEILVIGVVSAINLIFIIKKFKMSRYQDAILDSSLFLFILFMFSGTYSGMAVAMIASMIVSIYLYANPPNFLPSVDSEKLELIIHNIKTLNPDGPTAPRSKFDSL